MTPVAVLRPADPAPLVLDSPHSGSIYPEDFGHAIDRLTLRRAEDAHVDELAAQAPDHGATLVHALFPRAYIDPNRAEDDIDQAMLDGPWPGPLNPSFKTKARGVGLIWRDMRTRGAIYNRALSVAEVEARIARFWRPYHRALEAELNTAHRRFGAVIHLNCHSMSSVGDAKTEDGPVRRPDFIVSDRDGTTCAPEIRAAVVESLAARGHSVAVNDPYKGFEIVRRHGRPAENRHSLQIEINRGLYMDEATLAKTDGFPVIAETLGRLCQRLRTLAETLSG